MEFKYLAMGFVQLSLSILEYASPLDFEAVALQPKLHARSPFFGNQVQVGGKGEQVCANPDLKHAWEKFKVDLQIYN